MHLYTRLHVSAPWSQHQVCTVEQIQIWFCTIGIPRVYSVEVYCLRCTIKLKLLELKWISVYCNKLKYSIYAFKMPVILLLRISCIACYITSWLCNRSFSLRYPPYRVQSVCIFTMLTCSAFVRFVITSKLCNPDGEVRVIYVLICYCPLLCGLLGYRAYKERRK
jgi:hypothetical protein